MLLALILICSGELADCDAVNAIRRIRYQTEATTSGGCFNEVQAYIARSSLKEQTDKIKIFCDVRKL